MEKKLHNYRLQYDKGSLTEEYALHDPMEQFGFWFDEYQKVCKTEVNSMTMCTSGPEGPSARIVLLKAFDLKGFVFFTNYNSRKSKEAESSGKVGLLFFWPEMERQVRVQGHIERLPPEESDEYFKSRPIESQIGAWASPQSEAIKDREFLDEQFNFYKKHFENEAPYRPGFWGGFRILPFEIEFWQGRPSRLHDRLLYRNLNEDGWVRTRLAP